MLRGMGKAKLALFLVKHRKLIRVALVVLALVGAWFLWQQFA